MVTTLLDMLLEAGLINRAQSDEALKNRVLYGGKIGTSLIELGFIDEEHLAQFLGRKLSVPYIEPARLRDIPATTIALLPRGLAVRYRAVPLQLERKRLSLVMADPADLAAVDEIAFSTGFLIKPMVAPEIRLMQALARYYQVELDARYRQIIARLDGLQPSGPSRTAESEPPEPAAAELEEAEVVEEAGDEGRAVPYDLASLLRDLAAAENRNAIAAALVRFFSETYECVALFLIRRDLATGWLGRCTGKDLAELPRVTIPLGQPSVFKTVVADGGCYLGSLDPSPQNGRLLSAVGARAADPALVMPLMLAGRPVAMLYLCGSRHPLQDGVTQARELLEKAAKAFEILILRDKILTAS
jgi:hypothetical protein